MRAALVLLLVTVVVHGSQLLRPDWSGTEAFRSLIAHGMVDSGDYLVPRLGGELMLTKPPLFYWMLAGAEQLFGLSNVAMRLPALLSLWLCAVAVQRAFARRFDARTGWIAAAGLLCAPLVVFKGAFAEIDPPFMAMTVVSIVWLAEAIAFGGRWRTVAAGLVGSLALLTKGPPYLMFLVGVLPLWWSYARLRGSVAFVVTLLLPFAAYYLVLTTAPGGMPADELSALATKESVGRVGGFGWEGVLDAPLHLLRAGVLTLPFGLFGLFVRPALETRQERMRRACLWACAAAVFALLALPNRPVRYMLPGLALAIVSFAPAVAAWIRTSAPPPRWSVGVVRGFGVLAAVIVTALPWLPYPLPGWSWFGALAIAGGAALVGSRVRVVAFALVAPVVMVWTVGVDRDSFRARGVRSDREVAALIREELRDAGAGAVTVWSYMAESIVLEIDPQMRWHLGETGDPGGDWVIFNHNDGRPPVTLPEGFVVRATVRGRREDFHLASRRR